MGVTVFHSLTATTPDNTQYEIRPSHWNTNHVASLSLAGSDLSNAFSNSPTVTFGTSGGLMTASVNTNYAATNITTNAIALSNSSLFQQTSATSAITSAAFASANSSLLIANSNSSLFQQTSATSAITSNALNTSASRVINLVAATDTTGGGTASLSGNVSFGNTNGVTFYTSAGSVVAVNHALQFTSATSAITSAAFPSAQTTKFAGTGTTFSGTNVSGSMTLNSNGLNLALSAAAGGGGGGGVAISAGTQVQTSGTVSFANSNGITFGMSNSSVITASYTVPTQTAQTANLYATGANSTQLSSTAGVDLRSISISGAGAASAGVSGGIMLISAPPVSVISGVANITVGITGSTIGLSAGAGGGGSFSAGISTGGNTSGNTGTVSNQIVFVGGNNVTLSGSTAAGGATVTISGANIGGAQTGISGVAVSNTTYTSGTFSFRDGNNISFASGTGQGVSITHNLQSAGAYLTTAMQSNAGSNFLGTNTALTANGVSVTANSSGLSLNFPAFLTSQSNQAFSASGGSSTFQTLNFANSNGITFSNSGGSVVASHNGLTTAAQSSASNVSLVIAGTASNGGTASLSGGVSFSNANGVSFYTSAGNAVVATVRTDYLTSQSNQAFSASGGSSTFQTLNFANSNGVTFSNSGGSVIASVPGTSSISATGAVSISTNGNTISIGAPAFSAGVTTLGNTLGNTGTVSNQLVLAGGNNITLSGSTNAGGMTLTISGPNVGGAQTGISGIIAGTQTQTAGTVSFANGNGISFGMSNSSVITASYTVPTVPTAYVSSVNGSSGAISLNVGSSLSASTNGSSITFGLASNITTALQSAGAYLTTAAQSSASNVSLVIAGTAPGGGTASLSGGVSFSNANGVSFYTSAGNAIVASIGAAPTAYVSSVNGSSGAISLNVGSSLSASTNGSSITFGLASNITTALQSANANYLTSQSNQAISGSNGSFAFQTVTFGNSNGLSFYSTNGSMVGSYTVPTVPAQTAQTVGFYGSSQTTGQSSSSTFDARSMSFVGAGGISVGASNGSIIFSGATGGGGGGGVAFANSQTTYTSGTVSLREGGGAITIASNTGQRIDISVPAVSSIYGTNGILISSAGSSISIQNDYNKTWEVMPLFSAVAVYTTASANTLAFMPLFPQDNYTFSGVQMLGSMQSTTATNASYAASHTISYALYSVNQTATTMSRLGSSSLAIFVSASSNARGAFTISYDGASSVTSSSLGVGLFSVLHAQKYMNFLFASSLQDGGAYALGVAYSSTSTNAAPLSAVSFNMVRYLSNISGFGFLDGTNVAATANSYLPDGVPFVYSVTSGGWPSTIPFSDRRQIPTYQFPYIMFRGT